MLKLNKGIVILKKSNNVKSTQLNLIKHLRLWSITRFQNLNKQAPTDACFHLAFLWNANSRCYENVLFHWFHYTAGLSSFAAIWEQFPNLTIQYTKLQMQDSKQEHKISNKVNIFDCFIPCSADLPLLLHIMAWYSQWMWISRESSLHHC